MRSACQQLPGARLPPTLGSMLRCWQHKCWLSKPCSVQQTTHASLLHGLSRSASKSPHGSTYTSPPISHTPTEAQRKKVEFYLPTPLALNMRKAGMTRDLYPWQVRGFAGMTSVLASPWTQEVPAAGCLRGL